MSGHEVFRELIDALADEAWDELGIANIVRSAGLPIGEVKFGPARYTWEGVVSVATRLGRTPDLAAALRDEFGANQPLMDALAAWKAVSQEDQKVIAGEAARGGPQPADFLLSNIRAAPPSTNPGSLLNARYEVVPFLAAARAAELADLSGWCDAPAATSARLLVGPGGAGKTRLFIEWCKTLRAAGWAAGFLPEALSEDQVAGLLASRQPTVAVADDAETRTDRLALMRRIAERTPRAPLRVILLAREVADWWRQLIESDEGVSDLLMQREPATLTPLPVGGELRAEAFSQAVAAFGARLGKQAPATKPDLTDERYGRMLYLHMAALAAIEGLAVTAEALLRHVVADEKRMWREPFDAPGDDPYEAAEFESQCSRFIAGVTLRGGLATRATAEALAARTGGPAQGRVLAFFHSLYPGHHSGYFAGLKPDLLGESLVAGVLADQETPPDYLARVFSDADEGSLRSGFLVLGRISLWRPQQAEGWLRHLLETDVPNRGRPALDAALTLGEHSADAPLGRVLAELLASGGTQDLAREFEPLVPHQTVSLREVALWAIQRQLDALGDAEGEPARIERGRLLNHLGNRLRDLGRREEALAAAQDALGHYRTLAQARPDAFLPDLATSLSNLGAMLSDLGRIEEALAATQESVAIRRTLAQARPDAFLPDLAASLDNLGNWLSALGRREEALAATQEALAIRRTLAAARPDAFLPDLAMSLNNLGPGLSDLGRREEALAAAQEAVAIRRSLAEVRPDAFLPDLAMSLNNLGAMLSGLGRREEALAATQEAVAHYRTLAQARPDAFLPDLAMSLNNLGQLLTDPGREEALAATQEAVAIRRTLAQARPDAFLPDLALSLNNLGLRLSDLGRREEALTAAQEAVAIRRSLAQARPDAFLPDLATTFGTLGSILEGAERSPEALVAYHDGVAALAPLFLAVPAAFAGLITALLRNYLRLAEQLNEPLDEQLLEPNAAILERVSSGAGPGNERTA